MATITPWLQAYGYPVLVVAVALEGAAIPLPGGILMAAAAILAAHGVLSLAGVLFACWPAAVAGDNLGYWMGRSGGRRLLLRGGVRRQRLGRLQRFFKRFGVWLILFGRFFDGTRQLDGLVAGSARMPWRRFFIADLIGTALWVLIWVVGLYAFDQHPGAIHRLILQLNPWIATLFVVALSLVLWTLLPRSTPD
ncbi:DedA family protein [Thiorhodococcus mannitoliphagus]|uniref:DedA family protein n=1 Tax=Thiorhodococcus mannitoliphagus TaxID=329406 RepID=A0A6P1E3A0_9GAMM|nr:VTT domain-containing protein [Thiorhodococcus mannitoliphagus]NEX23653.1 DedA family protein [Thiorhodococcus mannitoliphagus]